MSVSKSIRKKADTKKAAAKTALKNKGLKNNSIKKIAVKPSAFKKILENTPARPFPSAIKPMLATLVDKPFDKPGWLFEIKWDGYRALAFKNGGFADLKSRNDKSFTEKFYPVFDAISKWKINAVVDGEIVVLDKNGLSNFGKLQNWRSEADGELFFYVFDILWLDGHELTGLPLSERRKILEANVPETDVIRLSNSFETSGFEFFEVAKNMGLEGLMAKKADSQYFPNNRSAEWLKIKSNKRQEVVIGGFTNNVGSDKPFSSLLVGVFEKGEFRYTGKIGTGFSIALQKEMIEQFKPLITNKPPFTDTPDINKPSRFRPNPPKATATWLKPKLVCEVSFTEMTSDGVMRHPSFEGMRIDKNAGEVSYEYEKPTGKMVKQGSAKGIKAVESKGRKTLLNPTDETQVRSVNSNEIKFTNLSKVFWPKEKATKRDLINYYYQVAPYMMPYLKDRPMSLNRFPNGIDGKSFYQKDVTGKVPDWVETYLYHSEADNKDRHYLVCTKEADLLLMANMGCIEMNPWSSTTKKPDNPDWCIIDLDPDKNSFNQVIECAQVTRQLLDSIGVISYCKTSGSTGLHIYIPLGAKYDYEHSKEFGRAIATLVHRELPRYTSIERLTANRGGKMYIDFLQNRPQATLAAPYSVRPKPGATVSMPLHWDEVKKGMKLSDYNIFNAIERLGQTGDIFKPVLGKGIDLKKVVKQLNEL